MEAYLLNILELGGPLLLGAVTTIEITLASLTVAVVLGLGFALLKLSRVPVLPWLRKSVV